MPDVQLENLRKTSAERGTPGTKYNSLTNDSGCKYTGGSFCGFCDRVAETLVFIAIDVVFAREGC